MEEGLSLQMNDKEIEMGRRNEVIVILFVK